MKRFIILRDLIISLIRPVKIVILLCFVGNKEIFMKFLFHTKVLTELYKSKSVLKNNKSKLVLKNNKSRSVRKNNLIDYLLFLFKNRMNYIYFNHFVEGLDLPE